MPSRTTKISEKLVLLPETEDEVDEDAESEGAMGRRFADEEGAPLRDDERELLQTKGRIRDKSYAERLPKLERKEKVARVTAYCTAQSFKMKETAEFLRKQHEAKTKLYDDCLYIIYALPLLPGSDGYRIRSKPILRTPGTGKTVLDLEMEQSELRDHHEGYFDEYDPNGRSPSREEAFEGPESANPINRLAPGAKNYAEMLVFSYGVVVFWNFLERQERDILGDLSFASMDSSVPLLTKPLDEDDYETEEFHFEYRADVKRPRVFNDMITLLPRSDHMVKLTISHAIAQSTKLCFFEERMNHTMLEAQHVPKALALTGELDMTRSEVVMILGRLYKSRVDINLCRFFPPSPNEDHQGFMHANMDGTVASNILDVPNFFWDSEPTLHPLYSAIREYLEIDERIKVLNDRCRVFLDLAGILMDSIADLKMSTITWIIIVLIVVSIVVTVTEVFLRFAILEKEKRSENPGAVSSHVANVTLYGPTGPIHGHQALVGVSLHGDEGDRGIREELRRIVEGASSEELIRWKTLLEGDSCQVIGAGELKS